MPTRLRRAEQVMLAAVGDLLAQQPDAARIGLEQTDSGFEQRCFPAARRSQQHHRLPGGLLERDMAERDGLVEGEADVIESQNALRR